MVGKFSKDLGLLNQVKVFTLFQVVTKFYLNIAHKLFAGTTCTVPTSGNVYPTLICIHIDVFTCNHPFNYHFPPFFVFFVILDNIY